MAATNNLVLELLVWQKSR